eukprot:2605606-Pyramimonas_sp.AAC.1
MLGFPGGGTCETKWSMKFPEGDLKYTPQRSMPYLESDTTCRQKGGTDLRKNCEYYIWGVECILAVIGTGGP